MEDASIIPLTASGPATRDPAYLLGVLITASSDGGNATIYEGQGIVTGRKLFRVWGLEEETNRVMLPDAIPCERGIFIDFTSHVDEVDVIYRPFPPIAS